MLVADLDLAAGVLTLREKKRVPGRRSTHTAPVTPRLAEALRAWLAVKPDSPFLFWGHSTEEQRRRYRHLAPRITA